MAVVERGLADFQDSGRVIPEGRCRVVEGLLSATWADCKIYPIPKGLTPPQRLGRRYQRRLGRHLRELFPGFEIKEEPWILFEDSNGSGAASPDFVLHLYNMILLVESKLTFTLEGVRQLLGLYQPLLEMLEPGVPIVPILAARGLVVGLVVPRLNSLEGFLSPPEHEFLVPPRGFHLYHWIG